MSSKKETVEQIYKLLMALVDDDEEKDQTEKPSPPKKTKKNTKTDTIKKTNPVSGNRFESMPERNMFKEDIEIDRKLSVMEPCPRTRSFHTIEVDCRVCGKKEKINPVLVSEATRYKCNTCAKTGG